MLTNLKGHHRFIAASYSVVQAPLQAMRDTGLLRGDRLRILLYHDIDSQHMPAFESQMRWLAQRWKFVSVEQFEAMMLGQERIRGSNVLLTFDDGFVSNRVAAERVLKPMGIKAVFFVVTDFLELSDTRSAQAFVKTRMFPEARNLRLSEDLTNLKWADLESLLEQGHSIGAHTKTHARLVNSKDESQLKLEIISSADLIAQRLGVRVDHFAYPFGDADSIDRKAMAIARNRFRFIWSAVRGDNAVLPPPYAVRRESLSPDFPLPLIGALLDGLTDFHYRAARSKIDALGRPEQAR